MVQRKNSPLRARLEIQPLEDRTVPAFTLTIDGDVATDPLKVETTTVGTVTTFKAIATGAILDVDDIEAQLNLGNDVVITTGTGGAEAGNISWTYTAGPDDLNYGGAASRSLTLQTSASSTSGDISIDAVYMYVGQKVSVTLDSSAPTAGTKAITLGAGFGSRIGVYGGDEADTVIVNAGTGAVTMQNGTGINAVNDITISGASFSGSGVVYSLSGDVNVTAPTTLSGNLAVGGENITFAGAVAGGANNLSLYYGAVSFGANTITAATINLNYASLTGTGTVTGAVNVNGSYANYGSAVLSATTIVGNVTVNGGIIAPGGIGTTGPMSITGDLNFGVASGGALDIDLGATPDSVTVTGNVTIGNDVILRSSSTTHALTSPAAVKIIDATGTLLAGDVFVNNFFDPIPDGTNIILDADAVKVNYVTGASGDVTLTPLTALPGNTFTGAEGDGTGYTVKLTGPGELVELGGTFVARATTTKSNITVTTKANASDDLVGLGSILASSPLGSFKGAKASVFGTLSVAGTIKSITANQLGNVNIGGAATDKTSITANFMFGNVTTPGILSSLTVKDSSFANLSAAEIGTVKVTNQLSGNWDVTNGVKSITAGTVNGLFLDAKFLGTLSAKGTKTTSGDIRFSTITLTGDDGTSAKNGLKKLTAKGSVVNTLIDVKAGNVGSVTVGRFIDSQLFLNYKAPIAGFNTVAGVGEGFGATDFTLGSFTTTAKTIGDPTNGFNTGFAGSQIAAGVIGKVKLSGVSTNNGGGALGAFGIKFKTSAKSVKVTGDSAPGTITKNTDLTSVAVGGAAIAGDFFFVKA